MPEKSRRRPGSLRCNPGLSDELTGTEGAKWRKGRPEIQPIWTQISQPMAHLLPPCLASGFCTSEREPCHPGTTQLLLSHKINALHTKVNKKPSGTLGFVWFILCLYVCVLVCVSGMSSRVCVMYVCIQACVLCVDAGDYVGVFHFESGSSH